MKRIFPFQPALMSLRKTIAILLLSIFLMNAIGYVGLYALIRWRIVHEISELIEKHDPDNYSKLILSNDQMDSAKGDFVRINHHEFRYQGRMYDIVKQKQVGATTHFIVIHDKQDEENFNHLAVNTHLQDQSATDRQSKNPALLDTMVKNLCTPLFFHTIRQNVCRPSTNIFSVTYRHTLPHMPFLKVPVPPPKII